MHCNENQHHPDLFPERNKVFEAAEESQHLDTQLSPRSFNSPQYSATYCGLSAAKVLATTMVACQEADSKTMLEIQR